MTKGEKREFGKPTGQELLLKVGRDFTLTKLTEEINRVFAGKRGFRKKYTTSHIQGYVRACKLPDEFGGHELLKVKHKESGIGYIQVCRP